MGDSQQEPTSESKPKTGQGKPNAPAHEYDYLGAPEDFNFFPATFNLPADFKEFLLRVNKKRNRTFIVKPEASC